MSRTPPPPTQIQYLQIGPIEKETHTNQKNNALKFLSVFILRMNKLHLMGYRKLLACL